MLRRRLLLMGLLAWTGLFGSGFAMGALVHSQSSSPRNVGEKTANDQPQSVTKGEDGAFTLRQNVEEVVLNCTVLDNKNHLVNDLNKSNFKVIEGKTSKTIIAFRHEDVPVSMGLLVDNSGSMRDKRSAVNSAALVLIKASNPQDEAFVVNFADHMYVDQNFTSNITKLREGLQRAPGSAGGTALYDTLSSSADRMSKDAKRRKQVLILVTDGEDNASALTLDQAVRSVQGLQGPIVYSIGLLYDSGRGEARRSKKVLQQLSDETGGIAFFPGSIDEVDSIAAEVARDIRNQYTIVYRPDPLSGFSEYRTVRIEAHAPGAGRLMVRSRKGYFVSKPGSGNTVPVSRK
jgi:Ca-activated chloride channel family protein